MAALAGNVRLLAFGMLLCFGSAFGQTFFIGQFGDAWREAFGLGHGAVGGLYSAATMTSGLTMIWLGPRLDSSRLLPFTLLAIAGLAAATALMALVWSPLALGLAFFGLRFAGQGLLPLIAISSMARYFDAFRGRAVAIAALGTPISEATLPGLTALLLGAMAWRSIWWLTALVLLLVFAPLAAVLLRGHDARHARWLAANHAAGKGPVQASRLAILREPAFLLTVPAMMVPGFIGTWIFFHQQTLVQSRGWDPAWFASCIAAYAAASLTAALSAGWLIDRVGAVRLLPVYLLPMTLGCLALGFVDHPAGALAGLVLCGVTMGSGWSVLPAAWAELMGTARIATIRSLGTAITVLASGASPWLVGLVIDRGIDLAWVAAASAVWTVAASLLMVGLAQRRRRARAVPAP
ncbi:MAG: MFS transporter [Geminicoccaceae bacterium]